MMKWSRVSWNHDQLGFESRGHSRMTATSVRVLGINLRCLMPWGLVNDMYTTLTRDVATQGCNAVTLYDPHKTLWILEQQLFPDMVVVTQEHLPPAAHKIPSLSLYTSVSAINQCYMLCTKKDDQRIEACVLPIEESSQHSHDSYTIEVPDTHHHIVAGSFLDASTTDHALMMLRWETQEMRIIISSSRKQHIFGQTPKPGELDNLIHTNGWGMFMQYESSHQILFCAHVSFSNVANLADVYFELHRICIHPETKDVTYCTSWQSHEGISLHSFDLFPHQLKDSNLDMFNSSSSPCSLFAYNAQNFTAWFDRKHLSLLVKEPRSMSMATTPRMIHRFQTCPDLAVVTKGIRDSKERRRFAGVGL